MMNAPSESIWHFLFFTHFRSYRYFFYILQITPWSWVLIDIKLNIPTEIVCNVLNVTASVFERPTDEAGVQVQNAEHLYFLFIPASSSHQLLIALHFNLSHVRHPVIHPIGCLILLCRSCPCEIGRFGPEVSEWCTWKVECVQWEWRDEQDGIQSGWSLLSWGEGRSLRWG